MTNSNAPILISLLSDQAKKFDEDYLDDLAGVVIDCPALTKEAEYIEKAYDAACERLGVSPIVHMKEAMALHSVKRANTPYSIRLIASLQEQLYAEKGWAMSGPWRESDTKRSTFCTSIAIAAVERLIPCLGASSVDVYVVNDVLLRGAIIETLEWGAEYPDISETLLGTCVWKAVEAVGLPNDEGNEEEDDEEELEDDVGASEAGEEAPRE